MFVRSRIRGTTLEKKVAKKSRKRRWKVLKRRKLRKNIHILLSFPNANASM